MCVCVVLTHRLESIGLRYTFMCDAYTKHKFAKLFLYIHTYISAYDCVHVYVCVSHTTMK